MEASWNGVFSHNGCRCFGWSWQRSEFANDRLDCCGHLTLSHRTSCVWGLPGLGRGFIRVREQLFSVWCLCGMLCCQCLLGFEDVGYVGGIVAEKVYIRARILLRLHSESIWSIWFNLYTLVSLFPSPHAGIYRGGGLQWRILVAGDCI